jgi:hypothetical protein
MSHQWTADDRDKLASAIASGVLEVEFKDRRVRYQDLQQMRSLLAEMNAGIDGATGNTKTHRFGRVRKGF